jgi:hypothetical protein
MWVHMLKRLCVFQQAGDHAAMLSNILGLGALALRSCIGVFIVVVTGVAGSREASNKDTAIPFRPSRTRQATKGNFRRRSL